MANFFGRKFGFTCHNDNFCQIFNDVTGKSKLSTSRRQDLLDIDL